MMNPGKRRIRTVARPGVAFVAITLIGVSPGFGQQGHPLSGSWHGEWGPPGDRADLTVIMDWDGQRLTGLVNPVTDRARLRNATLDSRSWTVRFEVDVEGPSGEMLHCLAEGRLSQLGSDRRTLAGTWNCGELESEFAMTRDRDY
jgi:hypothetical protein